ncbi:MAG: hypothetical protein ACP5RS_03005 [Thermoplasmata archaeon]
MSATFPNHNALVIESNMKHNLPPTQIYVGQRYSSKPYLNTSSWRWYMPLQYILNTPWCMDSVRELGIKTHAFRYTASINKKVYCISQITTC